MANLFDYLAWRGDLDFSVLPLNPVDFLIFSQISYLPFDGIIPGPEEKSGISLHLALEILKEKAQVFEEETSEDKKKETLKEKKWFLNFKEDPEFIDALISSPRFRNCYVLGFVNQICDEKEIQFSALCVYTGKKTSVVVFRGTDFSFVGWKEDFNMAFKEVVPAQQEAVLYLDKIAPLLKGDIYTAGHSKGGNLAVYSSSFCSGKIKKRIKNIYIYDSPGFHDKVINSDNYKSIKDKILNFIPQSSIIGMMLERGCDYKVVKSTQIGLLQHSLFTWETTRDDLLQTEKLSNTSQYVDKTIREWVANLDNEQREQFVEGVYKILRSSEFDSVHDITDSWLTALGKIIKSITHTDETTRKITLKTFGDLFRTAGKNVKTLFNRNKSES